MGLIKFLGKEENYIHDSASEANVKRCNRVQHREGRVSRVQGGPRRVTDRLESLSRGKDTEAHVYDRLGEKVQEKLSLLVSKGGPTRR